MAQVDRRVEDGDQQNGGIGCARDRFFRVFRLFSEDGSGLETDEGADHKDERDAETRRKHGGRAEGGEAETFRPTAGQHNADVEKQKDSDLSQHADAKDRA